MNHVFKLLVRVTIAFFTNEIGGFESSGIREWEAPQCHCSIDLTGRGSLRITSKTQRSYDYTGVKIDVYARSTFGFLNIVMNAVSSKNSESKHARLITVENPLG